ncbi:MAG: molybdopterin-dependent oxidoreductase, partial [Planctomycetales bacterium]|nr:molybdopterin-dependent oxidoreductase [Planctomycetales bacterium]
RRRYPTDEEIRAEFTEDLCRCGVYDRVVRAIKRTIGRPFMTPVYEVKVEDVVDSVAGSPAPLQDLPGPLAHTPDLDSWVRVNTDGTVTVFTGKVEIGQGIRTAVA